MNNRKKARLFRQPERTLTDFFQHTKALGKRGSLSTVGSVLSDFELGSGEQAWRWKGVYQCSRKCEPESTLLSI